MAIPETNKNEINIDNPVLIEAEHQHFVVLFQNDGSPNHNMCWSGKVVEIFKYSDGTYDYRSNKSSDSVTDISEARVWYEFSFVWRGVWEGRIYFKDDEYWSEEMSIINESWNQIEEMVKGRIKADNPEYKYFD